MHNISKRETTLDNRLEAEINRAYYANDRYDIVATFVMVYHDKDLSLEKLGEFVRATDRFINVDDNHYFIIFHYTAQDSAYKASQNLLLKLDGYFQNSNSVIAVDNFDKSKSSTIIINRLKQIIKETRKNSFTRVEDESILDSAI